MTEEPPRTGALRDVPPPRPVTTPAATPPSDPAGGGFGRAARAVADAVAGLLGPDPAGSPTPGPGTAGQGPAGAGQAAGGRSTGAALREVLVAVAGALRPGSGGGATTGSTPTGGSGAGRTGWAGSGVFGDLLAAAAPRLPIRDAARLRAAYPGATDAEIADALVARAVTLTSGIGMATGGLSAAQWLAPPSLVALPLELGTETVLVAAVEVVLLGELHELYGRPAPGDAAQRAAAYLASWSTQRAVGRDAHGSRFAGLATAGVHALQRRVTRRLVGNATTAAPMLLGAALGARSNRKGTEKLAAAVLADLRTALPH
ncbi:hypothetical protein GB931_02160 [Modestobacter sp. I12A-02628]|uniref:Uncharacterized protein n=1 Tax=Goekera deserti TaxID=2497753 RepID=A0A7K3WDF8_9ACTN|nr:hypothetical protein [Goekera deserti]MPQ96742.1 hypothetical protein [Goekera deserti]NDI46944.1 hypothetical protein [Goekera deserti]NEL54512.1 hypothetical protein [Goekera deserti]